jgi:hypothetical protein
MKGNSFLYSLRLKKMATKTKKLFLLKDLILINSLPNYSVQKSITYGDNPLNIVYSIQTICDGNTSSNYILNSYYYGRISKFDSNWNFLTYYNVFYPNFMLAINNTYNFNIIVSSKYGINSFDRNFNFLKLHRDSSAN